ALPIYNFSWIDRIGYNAIIFEKGTLGSQQKYFAHYAGLRRGEPMCSPWDIGQTRRSVPTALNRKRDIYFLLRPLVS
uniref:hypothetical protein n=1 Tax=Candidatus Electrothrix sp. TaxID=2170559 RepID=UPI004055FF59